MVIDKSAEYIINVLCTMGYEAYVVGGCVRDSIIGKKPHDWDICTNAEPEVVYYIFSSLNHVVFDTGINYGTVSVVLDTDSLNEPKAYEITTFRKQSGSRKMSHAEFTDDITKDLFRRDFTMNAIAYNNKVGLVDPTGGIDDINDKIIRCIGNPRDRFSEDSLRIARAVRFQSTLGFKIEKETKFWVNSLASKIHDTSVERIQAEFFKLMSGDNVVSALIDNDDVITTIIPELKICVGFNQNNPNHKYTVYEHSVMAVKDLVNCGITDTNLRIAALLHDIGKPSTLSIDADNIYHFNGHSGIGAAMVERILTNMHCKSADVGEISQLVKYHDTQIVCKSTVKRIINKIGADQFSKLISLRHADIMAQSTYNIEKKIKNLQDIHSWFNEIIEQNDLISIKDLEVTGFDLMKLGLKPGKQFSVILNELYELVIEEKLPNIKHVLVEYVEDHYCKSIVSK